MLALVLALAGSSPCPALPLAAGNSWTYRADVAWDAGGGSAARRTLLWTTTVVTVRAGDSALAATVQGWPSDLAWWEPGSGPTLSVLYCTGGRLYQLSPAIGAAAALADSLLSGRRRPDSDDLILELPLHTGRLFGRDPAERDDTFYAWLVERAEPVPASLRRLRPGLGDSLYTLVYQTNPDYTEVGFVPGLGVARYVYRHHGTTADADAWLVGYQTSGRPRDAMLQDALAGLLAAGAAVPDTEARHRCLLLPVAPPDDRLQGPHGDSLVATRCEVAEYQPLGPDPATPWIAAQYRWTSVFTVEDSARPPAARDTVTEEEAVVLFVPRPGQARAVWHERYETGAYAVWRSATPEIAPTTAGTTLLSVMSCVNGTGGCGQEFLQRYGDGQWAAVWQAWRDQLPDGFAARMWHGVRIDPRTLEGTAGFYGPRDPNCCPAEKLTVQLALEGDSLVLRHYEVVPVPDR
jgi:hypothetical protein